MNERTGEQIEHAGSGFCTHTLRVFLLLSFFLSISLFLPPMHSPTHGWYLYYVKYNVLYPTGNLATTGKLAASKDSINTLEIPNRETQQRSTGSIPQPVGC